MKEKNSALQSTYIIDGVTMQMTPAEMLDNCLATAGTSRQNGNGAEAGRIVDETSDPCPAKLEFDGKLAGSYTDKVLKALPGKHGRPCSEPFFAAEYTRSRIAKALADALWMKGRFRLNDLSLIAGWRWNTERLGNMAAFYHSVEAAADLMDSLGICLGSYSFEHDGSLACGKAAFKVGTSGLTDEEFTDEEDYMDLGDGSPFGSGHAMISNKRAVPDKFSSDPESWIVYVPFDTGEFKMGGSLLRHTLGDGGGHCPELEDADYFIDCYELVRELVEDKIVLAAATVSDGGLMAALHSMCGWTVGADIDLSGVMQAYNEKDLTRVLFSEIPGAVIQIKDIDFDYIDAEFLLQDVAYYPIGHPVRWGKGVRISEKSGISSILQSLISGREASEGED